MTDILQSIATMLIGIAGLINTYRIYKIEKGKNDK